MKATVPMFPKPKDIGHKPVTVQQIFRNGVVVREICNRLTKAGNEEYQRRIALMWKRQGGRCCLEGYAPGCIGVLKLSEATFEHEGLRGMGGALRDDRIEIDGRPVNGVAHAACNSWKGSRRIRYNR